jgi:hypothetical protein
MGFIVEHQGDTLTFLVLDDITEQFFVRSELGSAIDPSITHLRTEDPAPTGNYHSDDGKALNPDKPILSSSDVAGLEINPSELKLRNFLTDEPLGITLL